MFQVFLCPLFSRRSVCRKIVSERTVEAGPLKPAVQGWCSTGNPYIVEMMGHAGFDAVVIRLATRRWRQPGVSRGVYQALGSSDAVPIVRLPGTRRSIFRTSSMLGRMASHPQSRQYSGSLRLLRRTVSWRVIMAPGQAFRPNL